MTDCVGRACIGLIARVMFALEEIGVLAACRNAGSVLPGSASSFMMRLEDADVRATARVRNQALARLATPY